MSLKIGSTNIGSLYLGSVKIAQAYLGSVKVYESAVSLPAYTLRYKFYTAGFDPTTLSQKGTWTQVSSSPNVWDWTYNNTDWSYGPFRTSSTYLNNVLTGLYDVIDAGNNTGVYYLEHFFGYQYSDPSTDPYNGPVRVCDLHIAPRDSISVNSKFGIRRMFSMCSTLEYFEGNVDLSNGSLNMLAMFRGTSITTLPPFSGTYTCSAGGDMSIDARWMLYGCHNLTDISNIATIDVRFDDLSAMSPNDGWNFSAALHDTPLLSLSGNETNSWHANAMPIRLVGENVGGTGTEASDLPLSPNKVNIFKWRLRNAARFKYCFDGVGLTTVPDFTTFNYTGCDFSYCFQNNVNVTSGALAAYTKLSSLAGTGGTDCFLDCGSNTVTGQADLDQIPQSWGGNFVVQDYYLGTNWSKWINSTSSNGGTVWSFTSNIDYSVLTSMQIYTEASVSSYTGVNMRKTNVKSIKGTFTTSSDCYYWPCICQMDSSRNITWYLRTQNYNGMLTSAQSAGDMPGTLSVASLGSMNVTGGTFDPNTAVRFCFVVTNTSDASDLIANHGVLYNANFYTDPVIRVVTSTLNPAAAYIGQ